MKKGEFKDRLFDVLNDTDNHLPIQNIMVDDKRDMMNVYLIDRTRFTIHVKNCGKWYIREE